MFRNSAQNVGAVEFLKTLVNFYQTAQCSIVEDTVCHRVYFFGFVFVLIIFMFCHYKCQLMELSQLRTN